MVQASFKYLMTQTQVLKVQVVLAALTPQGEWSFLIFKTNKERGQFWQNITGHVEAGETIEDAAIREAKEESALPIDAIVEFESLGLTHQFVDRRKKKVIEHSFLIVLEAQWKPTIDAHEHEDWKWVVMSEVHQDIVEWPSNFEALQKSVSLLKRMGA